MKEHRLDRLQPRPRQQARKPIPCSHRPIGGREPSLAAISRQTRDDADGVSSAGYGLNTQHLASATNRVCSDRRSCQFLAEAINGHLRDDESTAIMVSASTCVGLTLPGMIDDPGSFSGISNTAKPARSPQDITRVSLAIL